MKKLIYGIKGIMEIIKQRDEIMFYDDNEEKQSVIVRWKFKLWIIMRPKIQIMRKMSI